MKVIAMILIFATLGYAKTYPILEEDFLLALERYAKTDEFKNKVEKEREDSIKAIKELKGVALNKATDNKSYEVPYLYTLQDDIPKVDRAGNIIGMLYPKGYTFNPLLNLETPPSPLFIFNPCDEKERAFIENYRKDIIDYMLIASGCPLQDIKGYERQVYLLKEEMVEMFKLTSTISIVKVDIIKGVFNVETINVD